MEHELEHELRLESHPPPIANARLGMLLFVIGEVMVFVALMVAYTMTRFGAKGFAAMPMLEPGAALLPVLMLLVCSNSFRFVLHGLAHGNPDRYRWSMGVVLVSAVAFLTFVLLMWDQARAIGVVPGASVRSGFFYLLTGAHALHALGGAIPLAVLTAGAFMGARHRPNRVALNALQLYWDFVTLVGLVIYAVLFVLR